MLKNPFSGDKPQPFKKTDMRKPAYSKGKMNFSWEVDFQNKQDLEDTVEILEKALEDFKKALTQLDE